MPKPPVDPDRRMTATHGRLLLAEVVRRELKRLILGGEFPLGSKLPNEDRLCERFGVSRVTIRRALETLRDDGILAARQGFGWFVASEPLHLAD